MVGLTRTLKVCAFRQPTRVGVRQRLRLSVIVPAYNEAETVEESVWRVLRLTGIEVEVILVDDGSTDGTQDLASVLSRQDSRVAVVRHARNRGKGAAVRSGLKRAGFELVVVHDADLELDPEVLVEMARRFEDPEVYVVYGSRWLNREGGQCRSRARWKTLRSRAASSVLSWFTNRLYGSALTDVTACYKMFRRNLLERLPLAAEGFDFCAEVTARALLEGHTIHEVAMSYAPRGREAGKKIRLSDGLKLLSLLVRLRLQAAAGRVEQW